MIKYKKVGEKMEWTEEQEKAIKTKTLNVMIKIYIFVRCRGGSAG